MALNIFLLYHLWSSFLLQMLFCPIELSVPVTKLLFSLQKEFSLTFSTETLSERVLNFTGLMYPLKDILVAIHIISYTLTISYGTVIISKANFSPTHYICCRLWLRTVPWKESVCHWNKQETEASMENNLTSTTLVISPFFSNLFMHWLNK